jgi:uncharacterized phage protein (TIGR01671 family)
MRAIKFRGKLHLHATWVYGVPVPTRNIDLCAIYLDAHHVDEPFSKVLVNSNTVGQFTGLTDVDGTEIYEGDIIEGKSDHLRYQILYDDERAGFEADGIDNWIYRHLTQDWIMSFEKKVIGNIHDNPELLKR